MLKCRFAFATCVLCLGVTVCPASDTDFKLALVDHNGQLSWSADGYKIVQSSAKPSGNEIGIRGRNESGTTFLGFLFLAPEQAPLNSTKCRDGALNPEKKSNPSLKIQGEAEFTNSGNHPVFIGELHCPGTRRQGRLHRTRLRCDCRHLRRSGVLQR